MGKHNVTLMGQAVIVVTLAAMVSGCANASKPVTQSEAIGFQAVLDTAIAADQVAIGYFQSAGNNADATKAGLVLSELELAQSELNHAIATKQTNLSAALATASAAILDYTAFVTAHPQGKGP